MSYVKEKSKTMNQDARSDYELSQKHHSPDRITQSVICYLCSFCRRFESCNQPAAISAVLSDTSDVSNRTGSKSE